MNSWSKARHECCRQTILRMLGEYGGSLEYRELLFAYHQHYATKSIDGRRYKRHDEAAIFLSAMERDGLIECEWDERGFIIRARAVVSEKDSNFVSV